MAPKQHAWVASVVMEEAQIRNPAVGLLLVVKIDMLHQASEAQTKALELGVRTPLSMAMRSRNHLQGLL